jgi:hypothetical protein
LKGILTSNLNLEGEEMLIVFQIGLFRQVEETHVGLRKQKSVFDFAESHTLFLCEI